MPAYDSRDESPARRFAVAEARDGDEAIDILSTRSFDVIVLDLTLPRLRGAGGMVRNPVDALEFVVLLREVACHQQRSTPITLGARST